MNSIESMRATTPVSPIIDESSDVEREPDHEKVRVQSEIAQQQQERLAYTIRDLQRQVEQRDGFIEHLESTLDTVQSQSSDLQTRLTASDASLRAAKRSLEQIDQDRYQETTNNATLQAAHDSICVRYDALKAKCRYYEADLEQFRNDRLEHDRQWELQRDSYQRDRQLSEQRLQMLAQELTTLRAAQSTTSPLSPFAPLSPFPPLTPLIDLRHQNENGNDFSSNRSAETLLSGSPGKKRTLADELGGATDVSRMNDSRPNTGYSTGPRRDYFGLDLPVAASAFPSPLLVHAAAAQHASAISPEATAGHEIGSPEQEDYQTPMSSPKLQSAEPAQITSRTASTQTDSVSAGQEPQKVSHNVLCNQCRSPLTPNKSSDNASSSQALPTISVCPPTSPRVSDSETQFEQQRQHRRSDSLLTSPTKTTTSTTSYHDSIYMTEPNPDSASPRPSETVRRLLEDLQQVTNARPLSLNSMQATQSEISQDHRISANLQTNRIMDRPSSAGSRGSIIQAQHTPQRSSTDMDGHQSAKRNNIHPISMIIPAQIPERRSSRGQVSFESAHRQISPASHRRISLTSRDGSLLTTGSISEARKGIRGSTRLVLEDHSQHGASTTIDSLPSMTLGSIPRPINDARATRLQRAVKGLSTDSRMGLGEDKDLIDAIASTMIGEWMWKCRSRSSTFGDSSGTGNISKHKRWVWISPFERTISWSRRAPKANGPAQHSDRKLTILTIFDVHSPNGTRGMRKNNTAFDRSIVVQTPERALRFTAFNAERHYAWMMSLAYVANPSQLSSVPRVPSCMSLRSMAVTKTPAPRLRKRPSTMKSMSNLQSWKEDESAITTSIRSSRKRHSSQGTLDMPTYLELASQTRPRRTSMASRGRSLHQRSMGLLHTPTQHSIEPRQSLQNLRHRRRSSPMSIVHDTSDEASSTVEKLEGPFGATDGSALADMTHSMGVVQMTAFADPSNDHNVTYVPASHRLSLRS